jgi:hypothetical protein
MGIHAWLDGDAAANVQVHNLNLDLDQVSAFLGEH